MADGADHASAARASFNCKMGIPAADWPLGRRKINGLARIFQKIILGATPSVAGRGGMADR
jgi:hypothetical protein